MRATRGDSSVNTENGLFHAIMNIRYLKLTILTVLSLAVLGGLDASAQQGAGLSLSVSVTPNHINVLGTGAPEIADVSLTLNASAITGSSADIALILDSSLSVDFEFVKAIAREIVLHLSASDQVAVISFSDLASVNSALSSNKSLALDAIDNLSQGNETALGDGLMLGIKEINDKKRATAIPLIILLTDGVHNIGSDPLAEATTAGEANLPIYPVGISPIARDFILNEIARLSGGTYFNSFNDSVHERLMRKIDRDVVANYIRIKQTLPEFLAYSGSEDEILPAVNFGREVTQLEWFIRFMFEGGSWHANYDITAKRDGSGTIFTTPSSLEYSARGGNFIVIDLIGSATGNLGAIGAGTGTAPPVTTPPTGDNGTGDNGTGDNGGNGSTENGGNGENGNGTDPVEVVEVVASVIFPEGAPETYVVGEAVVFDASGTTGTIERMEWDWTNNGTFEESVLAADLPENKIFRHAYARAGEFTVLLRVTGTGGDISDQLITVSVVDGLLAQAGHPSNDYSGNPTIPEWMDYYIDDGVVTDEESRDASARFAADVFIPSTQYRLTESDANAIRQIHEVSLLSFEYTNTSQAVAAGYVKVGDYVSGVGQHYVNEEFLGDSHPQYDRPPVLLFHEDSGGILKLAGVRYISTDENAKLFQITGWPSHPASAHFADGTEQAASDTAAAPTMNASNSELLFWHPALYTLTMWSGTINPNGLFASRNPDITGN